MDRADARAQLFDFLAGRFFGRQREAFTHALNLLDQRDPRYRRQLLQAHLAGGRRDEVDWDLEREAVEALASICTALCMRRSAQLRFTG
jgi:hypothetical protein